MRMKRCATILAAALAPLVFAAIVVACGSSPGASARTPGASVETAEIKQGTLIPGIEPKVTAYLRTWPLGSDEAEFEEGSRWSARQIHGEYLGEIIIAFAHIDQDDKSTIIFPDVPGDGSWDLWAESAKLKKIWPHLKQHLSVGGWGAEFSDTAHDPDARAAFIANLCDYLERYDLDGADIDWEYPVGPDWGQEITSRPEDRDNYIALLTELRAAMDALEEETGKQYSLSACIPGSAWWVAKNDAVAVADIVDNLKLMSYDYYGGWSGNTGHLANLYNNPADPEWGGWSTDQAVTLYLDAGVPAEKITLGFAFYGRAWKGVEDGGANGLFQKYTESAYPDGLAWAQIKEFVNGGEYVRHWDDAARAPFLYNGDIFITYTDEEAIREIAAYAKEKGLGGVMVWEYGHDMDGELFSVLNESIQ